MPTSHHELKAPYRNGYVKLNDSSQPPKMPEPAVTKSEGAIAGFRPDSPATKSSTRRSIPGDPPLDSSPLPLTLRTWFWSILLVFMTVLAAVLELLLHFSSRSQGWTPSPWFTDSTGWKRLLRLSSQYGCAQLLSMAWAAIVGDILWLQPLLNLRIRASGHKAEMTILEDYVHENRIVVFFNSLRRRELLVTLAIFISLLTIPLQLLFGAIFTTDSVTLSRLVGNSTSLSLLSGNVTDTFPDLQPFVLAANLATVKATSLKVGAIPFITDDGYTVEEFTLPSAINGTSTATANVSAVFNQASCIEPSAFEVTSSANLSCIVNTAWFGECTFSWNVSRDAAPTSGVGTLPDVDQCTQYSQVTPQHRPIVFFFSVSDPILATAVMCIPEIHLSHVQVTVDLATNRTSVIAKSDVTSPIAGSNAALNGLFLNISALDEVSTTRLQIIRHDMAKATFDAVQAMGVPLKDLFNDHALMNMTTVIYNTYLRILARGIYFSPVQGKAFIPVQVTADMPRVMLDASAVHFLCSVLGATVVFGFFLLTGHKYMRHRVYIPPYFGTIAAAARLMATERVDTGKMYYLSRARGWRIISPTGSDRAAPA